jgi:large subunit ribosomal protein L10
VALSFNQKKVIVEEITDVAANALSVMAAYYCGLTVAELNTLRTEARSQGIYLRVVPNTLAKRALENTKFSCLREMLTGPLVLAFSKDEPNVAARLVQNFIKEHDKLEVKAIALGEQVFLAKDLKMIADLPSRKEAISLLMSVMEAPITKFVRLLKAPQEKLVRTVAAVRDQKQVA